MDRQEQLLDLRTRILQAEEERLQGVRNMSITEARKALKKIPEAVKADTMTLDELRYGNKKGADQLEDYSN